jgi:hypothetical protein
MGYFGSRRVHFDSRKAYGLAAPRAVCIGDFELHALLGQHSLERKFSDFSDPKLFNIAHITGS